MTKYTGFEARWGHIALCATLSMTFFGFHMALVAYKEEAASSLLPGHSGYALVFSQFMFYVTRGFIVTSLYLRIQNASTSREMALQTTGRLGQVGQVGAFLGAFFSFALITITGAVD